MWPRAAIIAATALAGLAGCATQPKAIRADGQTVDPRQFSVAQTICTGEVHKADLAGNNDEIELLRANSREKIMAGCMEKATCSSSRAQTMNRNFMVREFSC